MSLAPQRPNFVLVWIGIVLLTFSFLSNFLAGSSGIKGSPSEGRIGRAGSTVIDDSMTLLGLSDTAKVIAEESGFRLVSDPLALEPHELVGDFNPPLADQHQTDFSADGREAPLDFPLELLEEAEEGELSAAVGGVEFNKQPETSGPNHALRPAVGNTNFKVKAAEAAATNSNRSHQNSMYGGAGHFLASGLGKAAKGKDGPKFGANVRARIVGSGQSGTILVSFLINNPDGSALLHNKLGRRNVDPRLVAQARNLVEAVEEVEEELEEDDDQQEARRKQGILERVDNMRRRELTRMLRLHPGGLEIIAEMTPEQLRALANKLDARSPKLRALMN